jgi:hypothetical protein
LQGSRLILSLRAESLRTKNKKLPNEATTLELSTFRCATGALPSPNNGVVFDPQNIETAGGHLSAAEREVGAESHHDCDPQSEDVDVEEFVEHSGDWLAEWRTEYGVPRTEPVLVEISG